MRPPLALADLSLGLHERRPNRPAAGVRPPRRRKPHYEEVARAYPATHLPCHSCAEDVFIRINKNTKYNFIVMGLYFRVWSPEIQPI